MPTILLPDDSQIIVSEGGTPVRYRPKDGELQVDDAHVAVILAAVHGSSLKPEPEAPADEAQPEAPAKES